MFEGPEYASYFELCQALQLKPKCIEPGDFALIWLHPDDGPCLATGYAWYHPKGWFAVHTGLFREGDIWLPRLDQWLAMLEEAGWTQVTITHDLNGRYTGAPGAWYVTVGSADLPAHFEMAPTREEACARLHQALTAREAPRA